MVSFVNASCEVQRKVPRGSTHLLCVAVGQMPTVLRDRGTRRDECGNNGEDVGCGVGERAHFFVQKDVSLQVRMLGIENVLLFLRSECASGLSCIFVVEVEGALQLLCGGKLFSRKHIVCGENRQFRRRGHSVDERVTKGTTKTSKCSFH